MYAFGGLHFGEVGEADEFPGDIGWSKAHTVDNALRRPVDDEPTERPGLIAQGKLGMVWRLCGSQVA